MGGTHFLQTGYLLLNRNAPSFYFFFISLCSISFNLFSYFFIPAFLLNFFFSYFLIPASY